MSNSDSGTRASRRWFWINVVLVYLAFAAYGIIRTPIPGANEPNYLSKAKNFWNPAWCQRDLYLQSGNSHWVFYSTCGALTKFLTLEQTAWVGRFVVWFALALGWVRMTRSLSPGRWGPLLAACLFLAWSAFTHTNFAGEWVVGGVEGKGFAYAFLWLGIGALFESRPREAALWTGAGLSFHPVVGMWGVVGAVVAMGTMCWQTYRLQSTSVPSADDSLNALPACLTCWRTWVIPGVLLVVVALPGFIPAFAVLTEKAVPELARQADELQIFVRLRHHLDPTTFPTFAYQCYSVLLTVWLLLLRKQDQGWRQRWFARYVGTAVAVAVGGVILGWCHLLAREQQITWFLPLGRLLKFYLFRTADLLLPIAVSVQLAALIEMWSSRTMSNEATTRLRQLVPAGISAMAMTFALVKPYPAPPPGTTLIVTADFLADWIETCRWVERQTPPDSLVLIPRYNRNFKWYAERAEYFSYKDMPQDTAKLLEWNRRRLLLEDWGNRHCFGDRCTASELEDLAKVAGPDHPDFVIFYSWLKVERQALYRNKNFAVYSLNSVSGVPALR